MARKRPEGNCHICGEFGPLSFEHIPPKKAFNNRPVISMDFNQALELGPNEPTKGKGNVQQKGMGTYTLCERCNNLTGHWYGNRFVDWCYQGMNILHRTNGSPTLFYMNYMFPLAIIKQILVMFFSVNGSGFRNANQELVDFVLNRDAKYLPPKYRVFVYYNIEGKSRKIGPVVLWRSGQMHTVSEISYPPFGYVLALDSEPPDSQLFEISHFARFGYNEFAVMELRLPVLPTHLMFPGDYRNENEIREQYARSKRIAQGISDND